MNGPTFDELIVRLIEGWQHAVALRIILAMAGTAIILLVMRSLFRGDGSLLGRVLWFLVGAVLAVFAAMPVQIITFVITTEYVIRIRIIMGALSLLVLLITLESIRRTQLQERYALLWVATALVLFLCVAFPHAVDLFRAVTGMSYVASIVSVAFTFLVLVAFHFSVSLSAMQSRQTKLAQRVAILEARLRDMERQMEEPESTLLPALVGSALSEPRPARHGDAKCS
jgi:hypothetical protein